MRKQEENSNGIEISGILLYISEISKLQVCESKGRDYVEKKWEKIFEKISMPSDVKDAMNSYGWKGRRLECDVLFTPVYLDSLKYFKSLYPEIIKVNKNILYKNIKII